MIWPFGKKPTLPPEDRRGWNEDWQIGDLAECLPGVRWPDGDLENPAPGDVLRVASMTEGMDTTGTAIVSALGFEGKRPATFWAARAFRKLRPAIEQAEDEFTAELRGRLGIKA